MLRQALIRARTSMAALAGLLLMVALLALAVWGIFLTPGQARDTSWQRRSGERDTVLFASVVERLRQGQPYYTVMGQELQARGFPAAEVPNWRTPVHLSLLATVTPAGAMLLLLVTVFVAIGLLIRTQPVVPVLLVVGLPLIGLAGATIFSEAWAGALIALSLAAYSQQRRTLAAVCGVLAVFARELAVVYALSCGMMALRSRRKTESLTWVVGALLYGGYFAWHVRSVRAAIPTGALGHTQSWVQWGGLPFVLDTVKWYGWAQFAPALLAPLIVAAGLAGTASTQMPIQARVSLLAYAIAFSIVGQPFNSYWGLMTAPLWGLAILHAIDGATRLLSLPNDER